MGTTSMAMTVIVCLSRLINIGLALELGFISRTRYDFPSLKLNLPRAGPGVP